MSMNKEEDKENWEAFMEEKFAVKDRSKNIFDILKAFQSPNPEQAMRSLFQMESMIACAEGQGPIVQRRKRTTPEIQSLNLPYWDEDGNLYTRIAVPEGYSMSRDIMKDTCIETNLLPLCRNMQESQCKKGSLAGGQNDLAARLANIFCGIQNPSQCPQLHDLFFYLNSDLRLKDPNADAGVSLTDAMFTARGVVEKNGNATGIYYTSTTSHPYYAACIQESGLVPLCHQYQTLRSSFQFFFWRGALTT